MRLSTIRTPNGTRAARLVGEELLPLRAGEVVELLRAGESSELFEQDAEAIPLSSADFAPLVVRPAKVICVGLNYRSHILEMGDELPRFPTLFAKFARSLIGANDDIVLPGDSSAPDFEAELGVVIGREARTVSEEEANEAIAGYTVVNDVTMRDWQRRTPQWLQGKTFEQTTPVGPYLVTKDELSGFDLEVRSELDGVVMQTGRTSELVFSPAAIISYISRFITLEPGDLIATGTPSGVGTARTPPVYLHPGQVLRTIVEGIGVCENRIVASS